MEKVEFKSEGLKIIGNLYKPDDFKENKKFPGVVVGGSWTTVKEQIAGLYAKKLAKKGFITLAFDHRFYGESEGEPRQYESPVKKIEDLKNALNYLRSLSGVDPEMICGLGVCASSGYLAYVAAEDYNLKCLALVAPWLHDPDLVELVYGGKEGVKKKKEEGIAARKKFEETGEVVYVPSCSATDKSAAMYGDFDYYLNKSRGAIPEWKNRFAVLSWPE